MASFLVMVAVNMLANILRFGGSTTGEVSAKYPNLFTPAPYTFSIWGVIYLLLAVFILLPIIRNHGIEQNTDMPSRIGFLFMISCILNILWIISWHFDMIGLSVVLMAGLLFTLILIDMRLDGFSASTIWEGCAACSFQLYLGWICAATIANLSVFLTSISWNGFGLSQETWTVLVILAGALIGAGMIITNRNFIGALAIIWAYFGIMVKHMSSYGYHFTYRFVLAALILSIGCLLILIGVYLPIRDTKNASPM